MIRVVFDTNVYISALMFGGLPGSLLDLAFLQSFVLVISPALMDELDEKLRLKFEVSDEDAAIIRAKLEGNAEIVMPDVVLDVIEDDPDDNRVLECAVKGSANYIVTGDRHLLKLGTYEAIPIVTVRQFLDAAETEENQ
ncbi:MAG TPA: putative toxin-antitoxin system toxin component, PIN family [Candidatus Angelobacter sp.]|nr:putative toxin-antitoxin system toxin component, PIN family [Candidatus Angelobacter sp.]